MPRGVTEVHPVMMRSILEYAGAQLVHVPSAYLDEQLPTVRDFIEHRRWLDETILDYLVVVPNPHSKDPPFYVLGQYASPSAVMSAMNKQWDCWGFAEKPPSLNLIRMAVNPLTRATTLATPAGLIFLCNQPEVRRRYRGDTIRDKAESFRRDLFAITDILGKNLLKANLDAEAVAPPLPPVGIRMRSSNKTRSIVEFQPSVSDETIRKVAREADELYPDVPREIDQGSSGTVEETF